ncbi:glycosyl hydrolase, partial [Catenulispora rubra]|uniref:glycosyl hydrolase n=1 Tax=Catenulispora rubra TaxID=280293 RepID=UPI001892210E
MLPRSRIRTALGAASAALLAVAALAGSASAAPPAPPGVTAANEINYLMSLTGNHTLSGQQGGANNDPGQWVNTAHDITGEYPALWGGDFGFSQDDINNRQTVIDYAKAEWAAGTLPALMMHACRPDVAVCGFDGGSNPVKGSSLSDSEWSQLITNGTNLNNDYKAKLDQFVPYFQQLKDAGIPVLFRPLHEMNEGWAWWGGRPGPNGDARLYQITHDYLLSKGLTNIIWVWALKDVAGGASSAASYYPGDNYVDVVGLDVWVQKFPSTAWYQALTYIAAGRKPMALAEVGSVPQPNQMASQPNWVYWNVWMNWLTDPAYNSNASIQAGYYDSRTLHQGQVSIPVSGGGGGGSPTGAITGPAGKCVDVRAANSANGTPVQLYTCNGTNAQSWTVQTDGTIRALGKCLDITGGP